MKTAIVLKYLLALAATLGLWMGGNRAAPVAQSPVPVYIVGGQIEVRERR